MVAIDYLFEKLATKKVTVSDVSRRLLECTAVKSLNNFQVFFYRFVDFCENGGMNTHIVSIWLSVQTDLSTPISG